MKVLYVTSGVSPYVVGGMQVVSRRQICGLAERGVHVAFLHTFRREARLPTDLPGDEFVVDYPFSSGLRRLSPWHYPEELKVYSQEVERVARETEPDVIYSEGPLVHATLCERGRRPVVFHPHGLDMYQDQMSLIRNLRAMTLRPLFGFHARNADCVITQGGRLTHILREQIGVDKDRIAFLPNSVPAMAAVRAKVHRGRPLRCLFVGRDDPKKGLGLLLTALRQLQDVRLDVVGMEGETSERIHWHGEVRDADRVQESYREADVLILPSYSEGMATVLLEGMRLGTPAIATDVGATREVVLNGETGWLIEPGSVAGLVAAIGQVQALDDETFSRYSANCIRHVRANFVEDAVCDRLVELLRRARQN